MSTESRNGATDVPQQASAARAAAPARLIPLVYDELRRRAAEYLRGERPDHTLQATALVHESYLRLLELHGSGWKDRAHFCSAAARMMRRILVDHARAHARQKRGGEWERVFLEETRELGTARNPDLIELDLALKDLADIYPRRAEVVELKFFGGLSIDEVAQALDVSIKTVKRDWTFARAWLRRALKSNVG